MDPNQRLRVLQASSPSLRVAAAPTQPLSVTVAHPQNLTLADNQGQVTPKSPVFTPNSNTVAGGGEAENLQTPSPFTPSDNFAGTYQRTLGSMLKPFAQLPVQFAENYSNTFANLGNRAAGGDNQTIQQNMGGDAPLNKVLAFSQATGKNKQLAGDVAQIGALVIPGAAEADGATLGAKAGIDALAGGVFGAGQTAADTNPTTIGDYFKNAALGAATGGALRLAGGLFSKIKANPSSVGLNQDTLNFIKNSDNPDDIHALLSSIYGGTNDALHAASEQIANSDNAKFIVKTLENLPVESAAATGLSAAASDAMAREKYGNSPLTGETAPPPKQAPPEPKRVVPLGPQGPAEGAPGIQLNAAHEALPPEDLKAIEAAGGKVPEPVTSATTDAAKPSALPPEDTAAIQQAGGQVPELPKTEKAPVETTAAQLPQEDIAAIKAAGGDVGKVQEETAAKTAQTAKGEAAQTPAVQQASTAEQAAAALPPEAVKAIQDAGGEHPDVTQAKQDVIDKLSGATRAYNKASEIRSGEKAARSIKAEEAFKSAGGGQAGLNAKLGALKGEYSKSEYGIDLNPETHNTLINHIESNPNLQRFEKTNAQIALRKLSNQIKQGPTPYDIKILRKALGEKTGDAIQVAADNGELGKPSKIDIARQVTNVPKSILASFDISAPGRQGIGLAARNPKEFGRAFAAQLKYWHSEDNYLKGMAEIASRPNYQRYLDSDLAVTGTEALDAQEEQFSSNMAEKIPLIGRIIRKSDRAFTGFLTKLRADVFDKMDNLSQIAGIQPTPEADKAMSSVIDTFSGRGNLGKLLEPHATSLNTGFFSPKLWKSRLDMINPLYYAKLLREDPQAAKFAFQNAAAFTAGTIAILKLAEMGGATVVTDPTNSDFGKIKIDNTRLDITGGLSQNIVLFARELEGKYTNSQTGTVTQLGSKYGGADRLSLFGNTLENKANPLFSAAMQLLKGKDRGGNPVNPATTIGNLAVPLPFQTFYQTIADEGKVGKGIALAAPDIFGISSQTYGNVPTKYQGKPDAMKKPTYNGPVKPNMVTDANGKVLLDANGKPVVVNYKGNETPLEKEAMMNKARDTAYNTEAISKLSPSDAQIYKVGQNDTSLLNDQQKAKYAEIKKWVSSYGKTASAPNGASSDVAKTFFQHWNSMDKNDQQAYLDQAPDANAKAITDAVNKQRSAGLDEFKPSNRLAKLYAEYENDINNHNGPKPGPGAKPYTEIDLRNKAKAFQIGAAKLNYKQEVNDIYNEGPSQDLKTLIANNKIQKPDLDNAIALDNQLYSSGLESSLKFSKKFRNEYGYGLPSLYGSNGTAAYSSGSGGGGGSSNGTTSQQLSTLVKTPAFKAAPKFKSAARTNPVSTVKFNAPNVIPGKGATRVTASPFRTTTTTRLRNSVGI